MYSKMLYSFPPVFREDGCVIHLMQASSLLPHTKCSLPRVTHLLWGYKKISVDLRVVETCLEDLAQGPRAAVDVIITRSLYNKSRGHLE